MCFLNWRKKVIIVRSITEHLLHAQFGDRQNWEDKESKRHGSWQKGTHNLVLALEWSKAIFSCLYCWDLCRAFSSFYISIGLKLIQTQFGSVEAAEPRQIAKKSLIFAKLKGRLLRFVKKIWGILFADPRSKENSWKGIMMINVFFKDMTAFWFKKCSLSDILIFQVKLHVNSYWIGSFKIYGSFDKKAVPSVAALSLSSRNPRVSKEWQDNTLLLGEKEIQLEKEQCSQDSELSACQWWVKN